SSDRKSEGRHESGGFPDEGRDDGGVDRVRVAFQDLVAHADCGHHPARWSPPDPGREQRARAIHLRLVLDRSARANRSWSTRIAAGGAWCGAVTSTTAARGVRSWSGT